MHEEISEDFKYNVPSIFIWDPEYFGNLSEKIAVFLLAVNDLAVLR